MVKAENDENVPFPVVDLYFDKAGVSKMREIKIIKDADHRLSQNVQKEEFFSIIVHWFSKTL